MLSLTVGARGAGVRGDVVVAFVEEEGEEDEEEGEGDEEEELRTSPFVMTPLP